MQPNKPVPSASANHLPTVVTSANQRTLRIHFSTVKISNAFGSFFTGGSMFDLQETAQRVASSGRTMIVATHQNDDDPDGASADSEEQEWLGTLSILSPAGLSERPRDKPFPPRILDIAKEGQTEIWVIIGVWVHPEYRRRGIGVLLVQQALDTIRLEPVRDGDTSEHQDYGNESASKAGMEQRKKLVALYVRENNDIAREMYRKVGFVAERDADSDDTDIQYSGWMSMYINN